MKTNEGHLDRVLRIVAGLVLIGLAATGMVGVWGYIGVVPRSLLIGRAHHVLVSVDLTGNLLPRLARFGQAIE